MPSKIRVLDEQTINQIAAGEVIENPASVVKELVENALDAGAYEICVEIKTGGRQLIRITDNGCGMNKDDALLCLERHATSKIQEVEDIHSIATMGFRGEAVPSIASISKFTLITSPGNGEGTMVSVDGGKIIQCCPVARSQGTTIEVKSLFFNVPVRKKFQRSPQYDANEVQKMLSSLALGYPEIKFELISDQKTVLNTAPCPENSTFQDLLYKRIEDLLGNEFASSSCFIDTQKGPCRLEGYIGFPSNTRHNRTGQYLIINKRAVFSPLVSFAVREGYGTALPPNRHPVFVLHLTIPGKMVDVNVHPQKKEVRLRGESDIKEMIMAAVRNGLQQNVAPVFSPFDAAPFSFPETCKIPEQSWLPPQMDMAPFRQELPEKSFDFSSIPFSVKPSQNNTETHIKHDLSGQKQEDQARPLIPAASAPSIKVLAAIKQYIVIDPGSVRDRFPAEGFCLVDQRAAHSRVVFEDLLLRQANTPLSIQTLLIPHTFEVTPPEAALLAENLENLNQMGLSICQAGPNAFLVDALPQVFGNADIQLLVGEVMQAMREFNDYSALQKEQEKRIAVAAARASISHAHRLTMDESQKLVDRLMQCQTPYYCPYGKPTIIHFTFEEIARRFSNSR